MNVEVLVSAVDCSDVRQLIKKMNIQTDAIIVNQCNHIGYEEIKFKNKKIKIYSFSERGVGLSRNNALMRATGDIVLFADDDEVLEDNYEEKIISEFEKNDKADMIVFNITSIGGIRTPYNIKHKKRVHKYNCLRYGAVRCAVKLKKIRKNNIHFSLLFGGGCKYGSGEDSIFIYDCIKNGFKLFSNPIKICKCDFSSSTWFNGYNEKYYFDKGALFYQLHGKYALLFSFIYLIRHKSEQTTLNFFSRLRIMNNGINNYKNIGSDRSK